MITKPFISELNQLFLSMIILIFVCICIATMYNYVYSIHNNELMSYEILIFQYLLLYWIINHLKIITRYYSLSSENINYILILINCFTVFKKQYYLFFSSDSRCIISFQIASWLPWKLAYY